MADCKAEEEDIWNSNQRKLSSYLEKNKRRRSCASDEVDRHPPGHPGLGKYRPDRTLSHSPFGHTFPSVNYLHKEPSKYSHGHIHHRNSTWPYGYKVLPSPQTARRSKFAIEPIDWQLSDILDEVVEEMTTQLVKDVLRYQTYVQYWRGEEEEEEVTHRRTDKGISQPKNKEQINRIISEEILYEDILHPVISDILYETAHWTFQFYAQKFYERDLNELFSVANLKLVDSMVFERLLYHEAQPNKLWTDSEVAEKALDAMILEVVLTQQRHMFTTCAVTQECQMLRNVQLNAVTDIALDALMEQLVASLSEDLKDLDDYQAGSIL